LRDSFKSSDWDGSVLLGVRVLLLMMVTIVLKDVGLIGDPSVCFFDVRAELLGVEVTSHENVEGGASEAKDLAERPSEVAVESGVNERIQGRVGVPKPVEQRRHPTRDLNICKFVKNEIVGLGGLNGIGKKL
jgi:hypothetical protein